MTMEEGSGLKATITVPFPSIREADIAYQVLRVDPEPKRSGVQKDIQVERDTLTVNLFAPKAQQLRVAVTSLMENLILVTETMEQFGPPRSQEYSHY